MKTKAGRVTFWKVFNVNCGHCGLGVTEESPKVVSFEKKLRRKGWREQDRHIWRCPECVKASRRPLELGGLTITSRARASFRRRVSKATSAAILELASEAKSPTDSDWMLIHPRKSCSRDDVRVVGNVAFLIRGNEVRSAWRFR